MLDTMIIVKINKIITATVTETTFGVGKLNIVMISMSVAGKFDPVMATVSRVTAVNNLEIVIT